MGASSLGLGSSPSPPPCPGQASVQPLLAFFLEPLQHWVGWQSPLVSGTPGGAPLALWTVCGGLGGGERGWAGVQGRKLLTRRAKDRVVPYPGSHPCALPPCFLLLGGLLLFLLAFPAPSTRAHPSLRCAAWTPKPGQPGRNMENHRPTQKRLWGGPPPSPAGRPFTLASFTQDNLSAWSANTLPALGRAPPHPGPVSEIAHDYCKRRSRTGKCEP